MPKKIPVIIAISIILIASALFSQIDLLRNFMPVLQKERFPDEEKLASYDIQVNLDVEKNILTGQEQIIYINEHDELEALYFHLYPNAFRSEAEAPFAKGEMAQAYPNGFGPGNIDIYSIEVDGEVLHAVPIGGEQSILKVNLNQPLKQNESVEVKIDFKIKIPPSHGRFGYGKNTINICNWYPILSVLDANGWNLSPYYPIGDPFYSDVANYHVEISTPSEYTLGFTGDLLKKENIGDKIRWTIEAKAVRDFAIIASEKFNVVQSQAHGIKIYSYCFNDEYGQLAIQTAKDSIKIFNKLFGHYPYKQFSVVAADFFVGGMEYPNIVLIDKNLYNKENKAVLEYIVAHEVAHQWWYGVVGNNQIKEPWLDEALTEYSTLLYYEKKYGQEEKERIYNDIVVKSYQRHKDRVSKQQKNEPIYRDINEFENAFEYQAIVYYKGAMFLNDLRKQLGDKVFFEILRMYFDKYRYKNATTEDFVKICEQVSGKNLRGIFEQGIGYDGE